MKPVRSTTVNTPVPFAHTHASLLLDVFRGAAALLVLLDHARNLMLVDYTQISTHRALWMPLYAITAAGHQAVVIFFVLSGFLVGGSALRAMEGGTFRWTRYLTHRLVRLWLVLIPGLLLTYAVDRGGIASGAVPSLYTGQTVTHMLGNVSASLGLPVLLGNLAFVQTILVPTLGSNGALWSLANEFWYYILFPLGAVALLGFQQKPFLRATSAVLFVAVAWFVGRGIVAYFPIWIAGAWLAKFQPRWRFRKGTYFLAAAVYFLLLLGLARAHAIPLWLGDYLLAAATFLLLLIVLALCNRARLEGRARAIRTVARFSFSLYVIHTPLVVLAAALLLHGSRMAPDAGAVVEWAGVVLTAVLVSWGFAACTEFHTDTLRARVEQGLGMTPLRPRLAADPKLDN